MRENDDMKNEQIPTLKLRIQFEFAIEVILTSLFIILLGIAFLFASNLLTFNWASILFGVGAIIFIYFKNLSYLEIKEDELTLCYFKYLNKKSTPMNQVNQFVFHENNLLIEVHTKNKNKTTFYLKQKNREKLLNYIINHYPEIPCLIYEQTNK